MSIRFERANIKYRETVFEWLEEPHVKEFWDNSQEHKNDILNFMNGRKEPSDYVDGRYIYWVGVIDEKPYSLIMTIQENLNEDRPQIKSSHLSKTGTTYSLDYMIGNKNCFGKGLGVKTLREFIAFFQREFDPKADTFFIDPDISNSKARYVYEKAGFSFIGDFIMEETSVFSGQKTHFLVKKNE
jgi:RimJ/RimL family protein N-acetyltransferase